MAYIGSTPTSQNFISGTDYFNGTGFQTAFTLTRSVNSVNDVEVVVNNVIQQPNSYTVSGTTLTLSAAPSSGTSNVYVRYLATNQQSFTVGNNTVGYNQLTSDMQSKFAMKNRIINGAMVIDQRNAGASLTPTTGGQYSLDRWTCYLSASSKYSVQRNAGSVTPPVGFTNYLGVTSLSSYSVSSGDYFTITQLIEGFNIADLAWGTANAKTVTLSFQVYSSLTGTFGGSISNGGETYTYPFTYSVPVANTWTTISVTVAGPTSGTWTTNNTAGIELNFGLGCGTSRSGTAGTWASAWYGSATGATSVVGTSGATFYITGVQLEEGTTATSFEREIYSTTLQKCQRYAMVYINNDSVNQRHAQGWANASIYCQITFPFKVTMRTAPSISINTIGNLRLADTASAESTPTSYAISSTTTGANLACVTFDSTGLTTYRPYFVTGNGTLNSAQITFSAEL